MHLWIIAIGKMKKGSEEELILRRYIQRCQWPIEVIEVEEKKKLPVAELKRKEGALLLNAVPKGAKIVVLDENGTEPNSEHFAERLMKWAENGTRDIAFLIGGANGHSSEVKGKADLLLSFGRMTLPHMLMRSVLSEQLYRAYTIAQHQPYHKE